MNERVQQSTHAYAHKKHCRRFLEWQKWMWYKNAWAIDTFDGTNIRIRIYDNKQCNIMGWRNIYIVHTSNYFTLHTKKGRKNPNVIDNIHHFSRTHTYIHLYIHITAHSLSFFSHSFFTHSRFLCFPIFFSLFSHILYLPILFHSACIAYPCRSDRKKTVTTISLAVFHRIRNFDKVK